MSDAAYSSYEVVEALRCLRAFCPRDAAILGGEIERLRGALNYIVKHPNGVGDHYPSTVAGAVLKGGPIPNV